MRISDWSSDVCSSDLTPSTVWHAASEPMIDSISTASSFRFIRMRFSCVGGTSGGRRPCRTWKPAAREYGVEPADRAGVALSRPLVATQRGFAEQDFHQVHRPQARRLSGVGYAGKA